MELRMVTGRRREDNLHSLVHTLCEWGWSQKNSRSSYAINILCTRGGEGGYF